jgi:hypothetical protein
LKTILYGVLLAAAATAAAWAADSGPKADVAAVRAAEISAWKHAPHPITVSVSDVHVIGSYAVLGWKFSEAEGMSAYKRVSGEKWKRIESGGGALDANILIHDGVPPAIARRLLARPSC